MDIRVIRRPVIAALALAFALIALLLALRCSSSRGMRLLGEAIAPPEDLFEYLVDQSVDISTRGNVARFSFTNKYAGRYDIGILLTNFSDDLYFRPLSDRYPLELRMEIRLYTQNTPALTQVAGDRYEPFIGKHGSGFSLFLYDAPKDLPLDKKIICEVTMLEPDQKLNSVYGPVRLYVRKLSDK